MILDGHRKPLAPYSGKPKQRSLAACSSELDLNGT
jgi:hypothetical protein